MTTLYKAFDGTIFENEWECETYENKLIHFHLKDISFYTIDNHEYFIEDDFSDDIYNNCYKVIIHNSDEFNDFIWLAEYCGWCEFYEQITGPGTWVRHEFSDYYRRFEGYWKKVKT